MKILSESVDQWGLPRDSEHFEYAPIYRSAGNYINHSLVKGVFLGSRQMAGYPHGLIQVSREMSLSELEALEWSNLPTQKIMADALRDLLANRYINAYRKNPDAAGFVIESILDKFQLKLPQPRESVRKFLIDQLGSHHAESAQLDEWILPLYEIKLKPIQWVMPSDSELEQEFHEGEIYNLLIGAGYPSKQEEAEALSFFKSNLKQVEIDPKDLDTSNDWRFRFKDYSSMRKRVTSYGGPKDPDSMVRKIQAGGSLPMPVVVRQADGKLLLAGGATRTAIAGLADQKIKALVFDEKKALERQIKKYKDKVESQIQSARVPNIREIADRVESESKKPEWKISGPWLDQIGSEFGEKAEFEAYTLANYWGIIRRLERKIS